MVQAQSGGNGNRFQDKEKPMEVRRSNITAAKGVLQNWTRADYQASQMQFDRVWDQKEWIK
jgi:hypothetical protein